MEDIEITLPSTTGALARQGREPNGRRKRLTAAQKRLKRNLAAIAEGVEIAPVVRQPYRRQVLEMKGATAAASSSIGTAIGRLIFFYGLPQELDTAATEFAKARNAWRAALGGPGCGRVSLERIDCPGPSPMQFRVDETLEEEADFKAIRVRYQYLEHVVFKAVGQNAVNVLCKLMDECDLSVGNAATAAIAALFALAQDQGLLPRRPKRP